MSGRAALSEATIPRVLVVEGDLAHDVFEVIDVTAELARVRSPLLFEIGEELALRIEHNGTVTETRARVRAHVGPPAARITELELAAGRASRDSIP